MDREGSKNVAIVRKVNKLLDATSDDSLGGSLEYIEQCYPETNDASTRKKLRTTLEMRVVELHRNFLKEFAAVHGAFQQVSHHINALSDSCGEVRESLKATKEEANDLLGKIGVLRAEQEEVQLKEKQIQQFMEEYQLSPEDAAALKGDINSAFLTALDKVRDIHRSCREVLSVEHQQAAVEIMESMYLAQIAAHERLAKYLLTLTGELLCTDTPEPTDFFLRAVRILQERPAQWIKVVQEIARVRKTAVMRRFFDALTKGTYSGKPLEAQSHDVVRFFGDVLAWLHQCIAEEADLMGQVFCRTTSSVVLETSKSDLLDQIFEGLCKHLRGRLDQALEAFEKIAGKTVNAIVVHFQLENVLSFYSTTITSLLGDHAALSVTLSNLKLELLRIFFEKLKVASSQMIINENIRDLSTPPQVHELLRTLKLMADDMQKSSIPHSRRESEFAPVLGAVVDPIPSQIASCTNRLLQDIVAKCVFRINLVTSIQNTLLGYSFTEQRQARLASMLDEDCELYVKENCSSLRRKLGFSEKLERIDEQGSLAAEELHATLQNFYTYASNIGALPIPYVEEIQSIRIREQLSRRITEQIVHDYERLFVEFSNHTTPDATLHTPHQMRVLLDAE